MADQRNGGIAWTDQSWNPVRGCSRVSPGCQHCYAEAVAARFSGPGHAYEALAERRSNGEPRWTGKVQLVEKHLTDPLRWTRPRRVFVNSMSDLFHENLSDETIDRVFAVMAMAPQHTFQVLTKRPERMMAYLTRLEMEPERLDDVASEIVQSCGDTGDAWPLPNVWLGVSVEDQQRADERIPLLLQTPAAVRFISAEPLLGPVDLRHHLPRFVATAEYGHGFNRTDVGHLAPGLDWVIVGGESGPGARPCDVAWIREIVRQCREAGVPAFVKQLGAKPVGVDSDEVELPHWTGAGWPRDRKGGDPSEWPEDLRVREFPVAGGAR